MSLFLYDLPCSFAVVGCLYRLVAWGNIVRVFSIRTVVCRIEAYECSTIDEECTILFYIILNVQKILRVFSLEYSTIYVARSFA